MMSHTIATLLVARIGRAQQQVLRLTEGLPEAALRWQAGAPAPSMRFHLWHLARWADRVQASLSTLTPALQQRVPAADEIWLREGLAMGWGLTAGQLGEGDTGMGLDDDASAALPLPERDALVAYARRAFAATEQSGGCRDVRPARTVHRPLRPGEQRGRGAADAPGAREPTPGND